MLVVATNTSIVNPWWFDSNKKDLFKAGSAVIDGTKYGLNGDGYSIPWSRHLLLY